eukprot:1183419-Prorocentrum_minimum.AAC.3
MEPRGSTTAPRAHGAQLVTRSTSNDNLRPNALVGNMGDQPWREKLVEAIKLVGNDGSFVVRNGPCGRDLKRRETSYVEMPEHHT